MSVAFCDESEHGFGWIESGWMGRTSHALLAGGGVWLVDPVDFSGLDERVRALGEPRAVLQLLDRHGRDSAAVAARLGVPHLIVPAEVPGSPFEAVGIGGVPGWHETALWWSEERTLVVPEAVGTLPFFCAPGRSLGVHAGLRLFAPPKVLLRFEPEHILCGHGRGLHENAAAALEEAVRRSRRDFAGVVPRLFGARKQQSG